MNNYESKYKEAFERARKIHEYSSDLAEIKRMEHIFPELAESEDENIRGAIIDHLKDNNLTEWAAWLENQGEQKNKINSYKITFEDVLALECSMKTAKITEGGDELYEMLVTLYNKIHNAYLAEKEGEQKSADTCDSLIIKSKEFPASEKRDFGYFSESADKTEPKFHKGDWTVSNLDGKARQISEVHFDEYNNYYVVNGMPVNFEEFDRRHRFWTIQDAKDGDVLATKDAVFIFKHMDKAGLSLCKSYCEVIGNSKLGFGFDFSINNVHPATKEQRDILFQKMKESSYKWNPEKKELNLLITNGGDFFESENCEQKPSWSEEDEDDLNNIIWLCNNCINGSETTWIPSQAIRIKSLIERIKDTIFLQPKQEWSEEDEEMIEGLNNCLDELEKENGWRYIYVNSKNVELNKVRNWVKSLKQRIGE